MKKIITCLVLLFTTSIAFSQYDEIQDFCTSAETKKKCKEILAPFKYDASKLTRITFKGKTQTKEIEVPLYFGEGYRFVFSTAGLPQEVSIKVYDKDFTAKKRNLLWEAKAEKEGQTEFVWEPEKSKKIYVTYDIPQTDDKMKKGCLVFVVGYQVK